MDSEQRADFDAPRYARQQETTDRPTMRTPQLASEMRNTIAVLSKHIASIEQEQAQLAGQREGLIEERERIHKALNAIEPEVDKLMPMPMPMNSGLLGSAASGSRFSDAGIRDPARKGSF